MSERRRRFAALLAALLATGCSQGPADPAGPKAARAPSAAGARSEAQVVGHDAAAASTRVVGRAVLVGRPPVRHPMTPVLSHAGCGHHDTAPLSEDVVVGPEGELRDVVVWIDGLPAAAPPTGLPPVDVDQRGCVFVPHVALVRVGQVVRVHNSDETSHNVRLITKRSPSVNRTVGAGGPPVEVTLAHEEQGRLACDIHPWMEAWICAFEHDAYAVTGPDGRFEIPGTAWGDAQGEHRVRAWHPKLGELTCGPLRLSEGGEWRLELAFAAE